VAAGVLGHPALGVAWLANKLGSHGVTLEPGHLILAGSFTRVVFAGKGDTLHADFGPLGGIAVQFVLLAIARSAIKADYSLVAIGCSRLLKVDLMDMPRNSFKHAIAKGQPQIGLWCSLCSPITAEIVSHSGFDWLLLDTEHSPNEVPDVLAQLQAIQAGT